MGFLLGAYGKLMAGKRVRALQARMMNVQSQMRRATRQVADMEKYFTTMEKNMKNQMSLFSSNYMMQFQQSMANGALEVAGFGSMEELLACDDKEKMNRYYQAMQGFATENAARQQQMQAALQMQNTMMETYIESQKEMMLQPLKDLEEDLQLEKDSLESQIQIAQADYEACKEMEKAGVKTLTPQYTGQG